MIEDRQRASASDALIDATPRSSAEAYSLLRKLGGSAYQLRAAARAADHFLGQEGSADRDTGSWLISSAYGIAEELASDLDGLAKTLKDKNGEPSLSQELRLVRTHAHQLHAATRAADHFLEQDNNDDRSTGSWLIAYALGLADKLASELDDLASSLKRGSAGDAAAFSDVNAIGQRSARVA